MRVVVVALVAVASMHAGLWLLSRPNVTAPAAPQRFASLSFAPHAPNSKPDKGHQTTPEQIRKDMAVVAPVTKAIRTYAATGGLEFVPPIAAEFGMPVAQGIWIDKDEARNELEIRNGLELARKNPNIKSLVVGNEMIYRAEKTAAEMVDILRKVKQQSPVPITTGEIWHVWLKHPELASAVDYLAVHILPYWEDGTAENAVETAMRRYDQLRRAFPGKHIVIAEFGWPSAGFNRLNAQPGAVAQARIIRDFMSRAAARGIDYNLVEAFDQPWKSFEGSVGPYWGMFDASRQPKFPLSGPITERTWLDRTLVAILAGLLLSLPILSITRPTFAQALLLSAGANAVGAWAALVTDYWLTRYFTWGGQFAMIIGGILLIPLAVILLSRMEEIACVMFGRGPRRLIPALPPFRAARSPKVSIHIPAYREPPEMLIRTLDSVAALDYPDLECIVAINNTPDAAMWRPIEEHCERLGARFKFLNLQNLTGFKAGALRAALAHTAPDAEIIGVLDADYVVHPDWLRDLVPVFEDPEVGIVQAPQDHRDADRSLLHDCMNTEYAGFFDIGMVERNENNAIIVHGTMCLVRRTALDAAGGWSSDTICEDSDLGLTVLEQGWRAHYTRRRYGWGLLPDCYEAFRKQRHRWAFGGTQIATKHLHAFLGGRTRLAPEQRRAYLVGWLNWMGAETVGVAMAILNLIWVPVVVFAGVAIPEKVLTLPILAGFTLYLVHFGLLYARRVRHSPARTIGAALSAMALQLTVARAVSESLVKQHMPFIRTAKGGGAARGMRDFPAFWESVLGGLLVAGATLVIWTNYERVWEINLFAAVLLVQSIPFLSALGLAVFERTPLNEPAFARTAIDRLAGLLPRAGRAGHHVRAQSQMERARS